MGSSREGIDDYCCQFDFQLGETVSVTFSSLSDFVIKVRRDVGRGSCRNYLTL